MADNPKIEPGEDVHESDEETRLVSRRNFLVGLQKWSAIVIGGSLLAGALPPPEASAWVNGRVGGGGGAAWVNGRGGWVNAAVRGGGGGGAAWVNKAGGGGAGWVNRSGGGGAWVNGRGGAGWINR